MAEPSATDAYAPIGQGHYTESQIDDIVDRIQRPTTSHSRRSRLWSRERRYYEQQELEAAVTAGRNVYRGVILAKHYPGTWRSADNREIQDIVNRVNRPTVSYKLREASSKIYWPVWRRPQKGDFLSKEFVELPECPKSYRRKGSSSPDRHRSLSAGDRLLRFKRNDENRSALERSAERRSYLKQNKVNAEDVSKEDKRVATEGENKEVGESPDIVPGAKKESTPDAAPEQTVGAADPKDGQEAAERPSANKTEMASSVDNGVEDEKIQQEKTTKIPQNNEAEQGREESIGRVEGQGRSEGEGHMVSQGHEDEQHREESTTEVVAGEPATAGQRKESSDESTDSSDTTDSSVGSQNGQSDDSSRQEGEDRGSESSSSKGSRKSGPGKRKNSKESVH